MLHGSLDYKGLALTRVGDTPSLGNLVNYIPVAAADGQLFSIGEQQNVLARVPGFDLANVLNIHDGRAMDSHKPPGIEPFLELGHGGAGAVGSSPRMNFEVVPCTFDPADLGRIQQEGATLALQRDATDKSIAMLFHQQSDLFENVSWIHTHQKVARL
jgi:hypothetical protein